MRIMRFRRSPPMRQIERQLADYLAGDLDPEARAALDATLARDPAARALLDEMRSAREALLLLRERPSPPLHAREALPRIQAAIAAQAFERRPRLFLEGMGSRTYRRVAVAATLLCAVSLGLWWSNRGGEVAPASPPAARVPAASERPLRRILERGEMSGAEYLRLLDEIGAEPGDLRDSPFDDVIPISLEAPSPR